MRHQVYLNTPAKKWDDGLLIGNGRLGASVTGAIATDLIYLNEETLWHGGATERTNPDTLKNIDKIRKLLLDGETQKATFLARCAFLSTPKYLSPYHPLGNMRINFLNHDKEVTDYKAVLDIDNAIAKVGYKIDGVAYEREYFSSLADNVIAIKVTSQAEMTVNANLNRRPFEQYSRKLDDNTVAMWGQSGVGGVNYYCAAKIVSDNSETIGDYLIATDTNEAVIYISASTDYDGNEKYEKECLSNLENAKKQGYETLKKRHIEKYKTLYDRIDFQISSPYSEKTSAELIKDASFEGSATLTENLFHFGRYLLISGSYNCKLPTTLQGIWNGTYTPPWESKYTININTEMNYWLAESCNLSECHLPLLDFVEKLSINGEKTARDLYGCKGSVAHHNTNLWFDTLPEGVLDASPCWPMGLAWLSLHHYEHFLFTMDKVFLQEKCLPLLKKSVEFFDDYLLKTDELWLSGPSISPENTYISKTGEQGAICMAPTMDSQIIRELCGYYVEGHDILGTEDETVKTAKDIIAHLPKTRLGKDGRILEWYEEYEEVEKGHRHISHLFGLHPGTQITENTPELFEGAKKTLCERLKNGGGHTGWSSAWIINMYARLKDSENAYKYINKMLANSIQDNLLDSHPPFQIDGNYGFVSGIIEMLAQSHNGCIDILPTLPKEWKDGKLSGVRLRGNIFADITWENHTLSELILTSREDKTITVKYKNTEKTVSLIANAPQNIVF